MTSNLLLLYSVSLKLDFLIHSMNRQGHRRSPRYRNVGRLSYRPTVDLLPVTELKFDVFGIIAENISPVV